MSVPANGSPAPDFTARNQHGESIRLSALRGSPVVIIFYPWAFSRICRGELAEVRDHADELSSLRGSFVLDTSGMITWQVVSEIGEARQVADMIRTLAA